MGSSPSGCKELDTTEHNNKDMYDELILSSALWGVDSWNSLFSFRQDGG